MKLKMPMIKNKSGFTLIELLVVIAIIGILSVAAGISSNRVRVKSRDVKRMADLELIRAGLEKYKSDCHAYPSSLSWGGSLLGDDSVAACRSSNTYINFVPQDPVSGRSYYYGLSGRSYLICASLELSSGDASGCGSCGVSTCNFKEVGL